MHTHHFLKTRFALFNPTQNTPTQITKQLPMSLVFPTSRIFVKMAIYLLLPHHFVYKALVYIVSSPGFVLKS